MNKTILIPAFLFCTALMPRCSTLSKETKTVNFKVGYKQKLICLLFITEKAPMK